jgi:hypothetical protein
VKTTLYPNRLTTRFWVHGLAFFILLFWGSSLSRGQQVLLTDNFNSASYGASVFNSSLGVDQSGTLAPVVYAIGGHSQDWQIQHGAGGQMLLVGWNGSLSGDLYASPNHNLFE